jgi:hypothetical protein
MGDDCKHANTTWGSWYEAVEGVTHMIEAKDKTCQDCGKVVDRQTRNGRKL